MTDHKHSVNQDASPDYPVDTPIYRKIYTVVVYCSFFVAGSASGMISPAMTQLAQQYNVSFATISYGMSIGTGSVFCGAILCEPVSMIKQIDLLLKFAAGLAFRRLNRQLGYACCAFGMGSAFILMVSQHEVLIFFFAFFVLGIFAAGVEVGSNAWMMEMWGKRANICMQGMHFCYAIGQTLATLTIALFLPQQQSGDQKTSLSDLRKSLQEADIFVPFISVSVALFSLTAILCILYLVMPYSTEKTAYTEDTLLLSDTENESRHKNSFKIIAMGCLLLAFYTNIQLTTFAFLPAFLTFTDLHVSPATAAVMSSTLFAAYAAFRGISIIVATRFKAKGMLHAHMLLVGVSLVFLYLFANTSEPMTWAACAALGAACSCIVPAIYSFIGERAQISSAVCGFLMASGTFINVATTSLIGMLIEKHPFIFVYYNLISVALCYVILFAFCFVSK